MVTARLVKAQVDWGLAIFTLKKGREFFFGDCVGSNLGCGTIRTYGVVFGISLHGRPVVHGEIW
jgi:hypothetical protein